MEKDVGRESDEQHRPLAFYAVQLVLGLALVALAAWDVWVGKGEVPWIVYGLLAGVIWGPEMLKAIASLKS